MMKKLPAVRSKLRHKKTGKIVEVGGHYSNIPGGFWIIQKIDNLRSWNIDSGEFEPA